MVQNNTLWFTTATSVYMMRDGSPSVAGLYKCSLDRQTGKCESPHELITGWTRDGIFRHHMPLMNVQLDDTRSNIYARTWDKKRNSWEIIRAPLKSMQFESYFRTYEKFEWNECNWDCCGVVGQTYVQVSPKTFFADGKDLFVAWEGFYKDCEDIYTSKNGLVWTIGISKLNDDCVLNGGDADMNFATCSEPVSLVYQNITGRSRVLPYGGFTMARSRAGRRIFFMTVMHSEGIDSGKITSEIWVTPEGAQYSTSPGELQTFGGVQILGDLFDQDIQDAGSIRLHFDSTGQPDHLCRTIFDAGVSCFPFSMSKAGRVTITGNEFEFVSHDQVSEVCHLQIYKNKPYLNRIFTVTTGLEVMWDPISGLPENIVFGCFGGAGSHGNMTTVDRHGNLVQTLHGAYPGGILFGTELPEKARDTSIDPTSTSRSYLLTRTFLFCALLLAASFGYKRRRGRRFIRVQNSRVYRVDGSTMGFGGDGETEEQVAFSNSSPIDGEARSRTSYFELSTIEPSIAHA